MHDALIVNQDTGQLSVPPNYYVEQNTKNVEHVDYHVDVGLHSLNGIHVQISSLRQVCIGYLPGCHTHHRVAHSSETKADADKPGAIVEPTFYFDCTVSIARSVPF